MNNIMISTSSGDMPNPGYKWKESDLPNNRIFMYLYDLSEPKSSYHRIFKRRNTIRRRSVSKGEAYDAYLPRWWLAV